MSSQAIDSNEKEARVDDVKRYLSKPQESRIQLDDLFNSETEKLLIRLRDDIPQQNKVQHCESATEVLACMAGALGRFGNDSEESQFDLAIEVIRKSMPSNILSRYLEALKSDEVLSFYPTVLIFTAYAIGLTKAKRWKTLHALFFASLGQTKEQYMILSLLHSFLDIECQLQWMELGLKGSQYRFSHHIIEIMEKWGKIFLGIDGDFERLFHRFEIIGELAIFDESSKLEEEKKYPYSRLSLRLIKDKQLGHIASESTSKENRASSINEFEESTFIKQLLEAGFAGGNSKLFDDFINDLESPMNYLSKYR